MAKGGSMMLLIANGIVLTFDRDSRVIYNGGVVIDGEEIIALGKTDELKARFPGAQYKDAEGMIIMPGMINTHMHLYSTFARGMDLKTDKAPQNFPEILEKLWWRLDKKLNEKDIYYSAIYAVLDGIKNGTTTVFDHHASANFIDGSLDIIAEAVKEAGIRASLAYEISDRDGHEKAIAGIRENERFIKRAREEGNSYLGGIIGLHASFTLEDKTLSRVSALADELRVPFHIHTAEGIIDLNDSKKRGFRGVAERLAYYGILRPDTLAIHGVHLKEDELELLKERQTYLIHNPESNMSNAVGTAPLKAAMKQGITIGLGTDAYTTDMFESIKAANLLQKHELHDPQAGNEVYRMVFENNREIASRFFKRPLGVLEEGAVADLILIRYAPPTVITGENVYSHVLMGMCGAMVDTTIVGGKVLMEDREVKVLDYGEIVKRINEQSRDFWRRF
jgi:putative selenium metabolism protein SsnA